MTAYAMTVIEVLATRASAASLHSEMGVSSQKLRQGVASSSRSYWSRFLSSRRTISPCRECLAHYSTVSENTCAWSKRCFDSIHQNARGRLKERTQRNHIAEVIRPLSSAASSQETFPPSSFPDHFGANQVLPIPRGKEKRLTDLLSAFDNPRSPIHFAFAYGSGVFSQESQAGKDAAPDKEKKKKKKMIDLVLAVQHPEHWHSINKQHNPSHYSWIARSSFPGSFLLGYMQRAGAGIWYHPYIRIGEEEVKYGVIDLDTLCDDLIDWTTLYVSGRMHKPVALLLGESDGASGDTRVRLAQQVNLASALRVALLLLPERFTEIQLYAQIASLSYTGDFRMSVPGGENANKVLNIVLNQTADFRRLYAGLIRSMGTLRWMWDNTASSTSSSAKVDDKSAISFLQDRSDQVRVELASKMPLHLREKVQDHYLHHPNLDPAFARLSLRREKDVSLDRIPTDEDAQVAFWLAAVRQPDFEQVLQAQIAKIVKGPALSQGLKGIYTAGLRRTLIYVGDKFSKWWEGRSQSKK